MEAHFSGSFFDYFLGPFAAILFGPSAAILLEHLQLFLQLQLFFWNHLQLFFCICAVFFGPCAAFLEGAFAAMFFAFAISPLLLHSFAFAFFFGIRSLCVGKMSQFSDFCLQLVYGY